MAEKKVSKDKYVQYYQRKGTAVLTDEGMSHYKKAGINRFLFALATLPIIAFITFFELPALISLLVLCYGLYCLITAPLMLLTYKMNKDMRNGK